MSPTHAPQTCVTVRKFKVDYNPVWTYGMLGTFSVMSPYGRR